MAGPAAGAIEDRADPDPEVLGAGEEGRGIQVPLHGHVGPEAGPGFVEIDPPVEADHVAARALHERQQGGRAGAEVDDGNAGREGPDERP